MRSSIGGLLLAGRALLVPMLGGASTSGRAAVSAGISRHAPIHTSLAASAAAADQAPGLKATLLSILASAPPPGLTATAVATAAGPAVSRTRVKKALQELKAAGRVVARPPAKAAGSGGGSVGGGGGAGGSSASSSASFLFSARTGPAPAVERAQRGGST